MADYIITFQDGSEAYLAHHGILGQKWGVRRYQNKDGTYTSLGKDRRQVNGSSVASSSSFQALRGYGSAILTNYYAVKTLDNLASSQIKPWMYAKYGVLTKNKKLVAAAALDMAFKYGTIASAIIDDVKAIDSKLKVKAAENRKKKEPIDEVSGFHKSLKEYSDEEDAKLTNPSFTSFDSNGRTNCILCSLTYEMRKRGLDVTAKKLTADISGESFIKHFFPKAETNGYDNEDRFSNSRKIFSNYMTGNIKLDGDNSEESSKNMSEFVDSFNKLRFASRQASKQYCTDFISGIKKASGNDSRGCIFVSWKLGGASHALAYVIKNGELIVYDSQSGKTYNEEKFKSSISTKAVPAYMFTRLDDQLPDYDKLKEIME